jgi:hypothetical protein
VWSFNQKYGRGDFERRKCVESIYSLDNLIQSEFSRRRLKRNTGKTLLDTHWHTPDVCSIPWRIFLRDIYTNNPYFSTEDAFLESSPVLALDLLGTGPLLIKDHTTRDNAGDPEMGSDPGHQRLTGESERIWIGSTVGLLRRFINYAVYTTSKCRTDVNYGNNIQRL